jgi:hypothetical protein
MEYSLKIPSILLHSFLFKKVQNFWISENNIISVQVSFLIFFLFFNFVMLLKWQSSIRIFGQICQYSNYESKRNLKHPFIL